MNYIEVRDELAERYGCNPMAIDDWTFDQIHDAWTRGRRVQRIRVSSIAEARQIRRDWRKYVGI